MRVIPLVAAFFLFSSQSSPQQSTSAIQRDPQAVAVLHASVQSMGGTVPADSVATGTITIVAGPQTTSGNARILTRGSDQSSEEIITSDEDRTVVYSHDLAAQRSNGVLSALQLELAVTSQSPSFPLPLLVNILNNQDSTLQYVGLETINGLNYQHVRTTNTFASTADLQPLAEFSVRDFWINAATGLPWKVAYGWRAGRGSPPRLSVEVTYEGERLTNHILRGGPECSNVAP
jgi:hypothetical protein